MSLRCSVKFGERGSFLMNRRLSNISRFPKPKDAEVEKFVNAQAESVAKWWESDRFKNIKRPYTPLDVVKHRGSLGDDVVYGSSIQAKRLFQVLENKFKNKLPVHTLGVIDPVQMSQLARCDGIEVAYVSGWACSSTMVGSTNEVSPDFGDYPYDTVPNQVERIFKGQQMHDKKQLLQFLESKDTSKRVDYLKPIIADADMGHGGTTTVMKLAKLFAEKGAAGIHLEDQLHGGKRCGHLGGAVIVPTSTHISRLVATRLQWDIMGTENLVIARTDSCNAKLLSSSVDPRDHEHIQGTINKNVKPWSDFLSELEYDNAPSTKIAMAEANWYKENKLYTFEEAAKDQLSESQFQTFKEQWNKNLKLGKRGYLSIDELKSLVRSVNGGSDIVFNWDAPRTKEGFYMFKGGMKPAIQRSLAFAPYADLLWLETKSPDLKQAQAFSKEIHDEYPEAKLVYNLSPSFNWSAHGFDDKQLQSFIWDLAKEGFVLQLVSLAGLHSDASSFWKLAQRYQTEGMKAYVEEVQKVEKENGCDVLTHQQWSGAEYVDSVMQVVQNGSSSQTLSTTGESFTETQF
ncbi:Icl2 [Kluyveromyces lactis]|nr:Icl2 [Kluyveromyces lactis]